MRASTLAYSLVLNYQADPFWRYFDNNTRAWLSFIGSRNHESWGTITSFYSTATYGVPEIRLASLLTKPIPTLMAAFQLR